MQQDTAHVNRATHSKIYFYKQKPSCEGEASISREHKKNMYYTDGLVTKTNAEGSGFYVANYYH